MTRIGINGFGRIGRQTLKAIIERFNADAALRTCRRCGAVLAVPAGA